VIRDTEILYLVSVNRTTRLRPGREAVKGKTRTRAAVKPCTYVFCAVIRHNRRQGRICDAQSQRHGFEIKSCDLLGTASTLMKMEKYGRLLKRAKSQKSDMLCWANSCTGVY
jgi:hypothetical protein